jgi:uncharacterized cupin superfamily protein
MGPAGKGLEDWGPIEAKSLVSGTPRQRGHMVLDDKESGLSAGVWDCTAFTGKMGPYSVNEFMLLLEGSVTIVDEKGGETVIKAGESFILPKGLVCQWKQTGYVRKFFVIFDDASGMKAKDARKLKVIKPDPKAKLDAAGGPDPKLVVSGTPKWHDKLYWEDPTGQWTVGVWSTTPYERKVIPFPRHELMHILEGAVTISDGKGGAETFRAGDTLFVPKGATMGWKNDEPVRKIYCSFLPKARVAKSEAAE